MLPAEISNRLLGQSPGTDPGGGITSAQFEDLLDVQETIHNAVIDQTDRLERVERIARIEPRQAHEELTRFAIEDSR